MVVNESQSFRGSFLMYAILMIELPIVLFLLVLALNGSLGEEGFIIVTLVIGIQIIVFYLLMSLRLEVKMGVDDLAYRNPPFIRRWRKIKKDEIISIRVKKVNGIFEYGGFGVKRSINRTAYIFPADHVIEIQLPKRKLVFSTNKYPQFEDMVQNWNSRLIDEE